MADENQSSATPAGESVTPPEPETAATWPPDASAPDPDAPADTSAPEPTWPPDASAQEPGVAATMTVPPLEGSQEGPDGGGEWELLTAKLQHWLNSGQLQELWQSARTPLLALPAVLAAVLVLRVYAALLAALEGLPLVPGLLELVGLIWILRQGLPKLLRSSEREELIGQLQRRWNAFFGKS